MTFILENKPIDIFTCPDCFKVIVTNEFEDNIMCGENKPYMTIRTTGCPICKSILTKNITRLAKKEGK